ncbi:hypothetical protein NPIL_369611, partial [Nephila pilipes]
GKKSRFCGKRLRRRRQAVQAEQAAQAEVELSCFAGGAGGGRVEWLCRRSRLRRRWSS